MDLTKRPVLISRKVLLTYSLRKNIVELFRGGFFALPLKLLLFNSFTIIAAFFSAEYIPDSLDEAKYWFQRSGAIVTLVTIWVEVKLLNIISKRDIFNEITDLKVTLSHHISNFNVTMLDDGEARKAKKGDIEFIRSQTKNRAKFFNGVVFLNLIIGTVIWAYGDLIYLSIV